MTIRIIVPLKWESPFRTILFSKLKELGYTWSKGDSLDSTYNRLHSMAYIAIYVTEPIIKFSSKPELGQKPLSECGFNYVMVYPTLDNVLQSIKYIQQYLSENPDEDEVKDFILTHHSLKDMLLLL